MATSKQMKKILEIYEDVDTAVLQNILGSGILSVLRMKPDLVPQFMSVSSGLSEIVAIRHIIDLDAYPMVPDDWSVDEHQKGGSFEWDAAKVTLYLPEQQKDDKWINGKELHKKLRGKPVFNACLLDYLLAHPHLIPEEWKGKSVFFWGTIYRGSGVSLYYVPCLRSSGGGWYRSGDRLDYAFHEDCLAAVFAKRELPKAA